MEKFFHLSLRGTDKKTEIIAGLTTFMTMAYVLAVQPAAICGGEAYITDVNGVVITKSAIMITCALVSGLITLLMAFYTNFPFALSTGMGSNFILGALIQSQALSFGAAMAITLISGIVFLLLTVFGLRDLIVRVIPKNIKIAISASIGFFIAYLGFQNSGIGSFENGIALGNLADPAVLLAIGGLLLIIVLNALHVKGAILISIIATTLIGIPLGVTTINGVAAMPNFGDIGNIMFNLDFKGVFTASGLILVFVCFFGDFFSTLGTVLAVANRANMLDEHGNLPGIERPFLVDAIGTCIGALTGNTTITTFVESTSGVEAGGRTGLTALVAGIMFLLTIFLAPLFVAIPYAATGPALIYVGFLMLKGFTEIDFTDYDESIGPCVMMMFTAFTGNITNGLGAGIIVHVLVKLVRGKAKEYGVTVTEFLCAAMMKAILDLQAEKVHFRRHRRPVKVLIPVNLRKLFPSRTLRNFALYVTPEIDPQLGDYSFKEICSVVHHRMGLDCTAKLMGTRIAANVSSEKAFILKVMPLFIKNAAMKAVFDAVGECKSCLCLSNLGNVTVPEAMRPYISRMDFIIGVQARAPHNCGVLSLSLIHISEPTRPY
mgnify:CR=1 FL=1